MGEKMTINIQLGMRGFFLIEGRLPLYDKSGEILLDRMGHAIPDESTYRVIADWFPNKFLTSGRNEIAKRSSWASVNSYCQVGTDFTPPVIADTALGGWVAGTNVQQDHASGAQSVAPWYGWDQYTYRFAIPGEAAGNLNEVGVGWAASGATLVTRALIRAPDGTPTTVSPLADEILDVTYELRYYPPLEDVLGTITLDGTVYDTITRASQVNHADYQGAKIGLEIGYSTQYANSFSAYDGAIGTITQSPSGNDEDLTTTPTSLNYGNNNYYRDIQAQASLGEWVLPASAGIRCVVCSTTGGRFQTQFTAQGTGNTVPKTGSQTMSLTWRLSWAGLDVTGDWTMQVAHDSTTPTAGNWNTNTAQTLLRINWEDADTDDRQLDLQTENGALIKVVETADYTKWINYRVSSVYTEGTDWTEYTVAQETISVSGGPSATNLCTLRTVND